MSPTATSIGDVFVTVLTDTSDLERSLTDSLQKGLNKARLGSGIATAIGAGVAAAVSGLAPLEREINRIFSVQGIDVTDELVQNLGSQILDVANEAGLAGQAVGAAVAAGVGRGFSQETSLDLAKQAGDLAVAVGSDLAPAMASITGVINSYGEANLKASDAAEVLFETVTFSNVPLAELARQIGNITPSAAAAGVSLAEIGAAFSTMTSQGLTAAESTTQLRTLFTELNQEASKGSKVFEAISGKTFPEFVKAGGTMKQAVDLIAAASAGAEVPISGLFGNVNSGNAVMALTGASADRFAGFLDKTTQSTGRLDTAVENANTGTLRRLEMAFNRIKNAVAAVALAMRPLQKAIESQLLGGVDAASGAIGTLSANLTAINWDAVAQGISSFLVQLSPIRDLIVSIFTVITAINWSAIGAGLTAAFAPFAALIVGLMPVVSLLANVIGNVLAPAVGFLTGAIRPLAPLIAGLVAGFITLQVATYAQIVAMQIMNATLLTTARNGIKAAIAGLSSLWAVMMANPVVAVIAVIVALAAAFIYAWKHSETFRDIVRSAFVKTAEGIGAAVKAIISLAAMWVNAYLMGFKKILDGLGHLPDWLGGGKFDDASAAVQRLINGVNDIRDSLHGLVDDAVAAAKALAAVGASGGVVMSREGQLPPGALLAQKRAAAAAAKVGGGGGGGLTPNLGALDKVLNPEKDAKSAAAAKKRLKNLIADLFEATQKLAKNIGNKSLSSIESGFSSLIGKYTDAIAAATEQGNKTVAAKLKSSLKQVKGFEKALESMARARDKITEKMKKEEDKLEALTDKYAAVVDSMKKSFVELGNISNTEQMRTVFRQGLFPSASAQIQNLKRALYITDRFAAAIKKLQKLGLKRTSLDQLIAAGPEAGLGAAEGLAAGGKKAVAQVNTLTNQLKANGEKLGSSLADQFYGHGIKISEGLLKGLESDKAKLIKAMDRLGSEMAKSFKKTMGIHSPSTVFEGFGEDITAGLGLGIAGGVGKVRNPGSGSPSITFGPGAIVVNGVKNGEEQKGGMLTGRGIVGVLESRSTAAALAGIGG